MGAEDLGALSRQEEINLNKRRSRMLVADVEKAKAAYKLAFKAALAADEEFGGTSQKSERAWREVHNAQKEVDLAQEDLDRWEPNSDDEDPYQAKANACDESLPSSDEDAERRRLWALLEKAPEQKRWKGKCRGAKRRKVKEERARLHMEKVWEQIFAI